MTPLSLETNRLRLVLLDTADLLADLEALSPEDRAQVSPAWLARLQAAAVPDPWTHGFRIVDRVSGQGVGSCGFKGPPDAEGVVEIAYGIEVGCRGQGYAREAAAALVDYACRQAGVRVVRAHTLADATQPEAAASRQVLVRCGFRSCGFVVDPEDGLVERWQRDEASPGDVGRPS